MATNVHTSPVSTPLVMWVCGFFQWKARSLSSTLKLGLTLWIAFADGIQGRWRCARAEAKPQEDLDFHSFSQAPVNELGLAWVLMGHQSPLLSLSKSNQWSHKWWGCPRPALSWPLNLWAIPALTSTRYQPWPQPWLVRGCPGETKTTQLICRFVGNKKCFMFQDAEFGVLVALVSFSDTVIATDRATNLWLFYIPFLIHEIKAKQWLYWKRKLDCTQKKNNQWRISHQEYVC